MLTIEIIITQFFIAPDLIPVWLRWLQWVMPLTYSVKLSVSYEFNRDCGDYQENCNSVLKIANVDPDDVWWYWLALAGIFVVLRLGALALLKRKAAM